MADRGAIEGRGERLSGDGGQVHRAPAEVGDLLRMSLGPAGVGPACRVTGIRGRRRVAALERRRQSRIADRSGEAPVAHALEAPVPTLRRQPDLEGDPRVGGGMHDAPHSAEGGKLHGPGRPQFSRQLERPSRLERRLRDVRIGRSMGFETRAIGRSGRARGAKCERQTDATGRHRHCSHASSPPRASQPDGPSGPV